MKKDRILYKRNNTWIRFLGLVVGLTSIVIMCGGIYYNLKIDYLIIFLVMILGFSVYIFTGYTNEMIVLYNREGFKKQDTEFIEWDHLEYWSIIIREEVSPTGPFIYKHYYRSGIIKKHTLKLQLDDGRTILFQDDEYADIAQLIRFLRRHQKDKQKNTTKEFINLLNKFLTYLLAMFIYFFIKKMMN